MAPPADKQQDAGQFNAWLTNLGTSKGGARPMPQRPPAAAKPQAPPPQTVKQGGLLGSVDEELDDIFGRITTEDAAPTASIPTSVQPTAPTPMRPAPPVAPAPIPRPSQEVPRPPVRPQPSPQPQQAAPFRTAQQPTISMPRVPEPPPLAAAPPQPTFQQPAQIQVPAAQMEAAMAEAKAAMQAQIKELQAKYQEQRQKWEGMLADLRARNDELYRQNQALEEEMSALRERQRMLLAELASQRQGGGNVATTPQPVEPPMSAVEVEPVVPEVRLPEVSIETAPQKTEAFMGNKPETTFEISTIQAETTPQGEADDLLAELEALEKEMKNLGGEVQG